MTIDAESAWDLILQARSAWRPGTAAQPQRLAGHPALFEVDPDGSWKASGVVVNAAAAALLELYLPLLRPRLAIGQLGQSLDGRIATHKGHSHYVTGPDSLRHLHRVRALVDAVVVGASTVTEDDPQLTVRHCRGPNPLRVVLDPKRRLSARHRLFNDGQAPTLVVGTVAAPAPGRAEAVVLSPADDGAGIVPADVLALLARRGAHRVLIEGGGVTVSRFLAAGALDLLHVMVAPLLIGAGRHGVTLPPVDRIENALRPAHRRIALGEDTLYELRLT